jgi:hypothetical protein
MRPPHDLTGLDVEIVESDLATVHVHSTYDRHGDLLELLNSFRRIFCG